VGKKEVPAVTEKNPDSPKIELYPACYVGKWIRVILINGAEWLVRLEGFARIAQERSLLVSFGRPESEELFRIIPWHAVLVIQPDLQQATQKEVQDV
jgi:hypothetical protein